MSRIALVDPRNANAEQKGSPDAVNGRLGAMPNCLAVIANSPAVLDRGKGELGGA